MISYETFEEFADGVKLVEYSDELKEKLISIGIDKDLIEAHSDQYLYCLACSETERLVVRFAKENNLKVVTYCIHDIKDGTSYSYENMMVFVNREGYLFCEKTELSEYVETIMDNELE